MSFFSSTLILFAFVAVPVTSPTTLPVNPAELILPCTAPLVTKVITSAPPAANPVLLPRSYFKILENLKEDFGAKSQIKKNDIVTVNTDIGTVFDIDTISNLKIAESIL